MIELLLFVMFVAWILMGWVSGLPAFASERMMINYGNNYTCIAGCKRFHQLFGRQKVKEDTVDELMSV